MESIRLQLIDWLLVEMALLLIDLTCQKLVLAI
jgi:hypothetical protein